MQLSHHKGPRSHCSRQLKRNHRHSRHHLQNPTNPGSSSANPSLTNPGTTKSRLRKFRGAKVQTLKNIKQNHIFSLPFQVCTFAPSKFSQSTLVVLGLLVVKIHTICPPPCLLKTMRVSRYTLAQLCDSKANIVWWGCGGGRTSRSSTSFT